MQVLTIHRHVQDGNWEAVLSELANGAPVGTRDPATNHTVLMSAIAHPAADIDLIRALVDRGADVNAVAPPPTLPEMPSIEAMDAVVESMSSEFGEAFGKEFRSVFAQVDNLRRDSTPDAGERPLGLAVSTGRPDIAEFLIASGADVLYTRGEYGVLLDALHGHDIRSDENLVRTVRLLISRGARLDTITSYRESALSVSSHMGRFDVVRVLLDAGADPSPLEWTSLHRAVALGTFADVQKELAAGGDLAARDAWSRTPWLLAIAAGDLEKVRFLLSAGSNRDDQGRCGTPPLMYAVEARSVAILEALLADGFDPDQANEFGRTAIMAAIEADDQAMVAALAEAGGNVQLNVHGQSLISDVSSVEMARLLVSLADADLNNVGPEVRRKMTRLPPVGNLVTSREEYEAGRRRRFGIANPSPISEPFYRAMILSGVNAYAARSMFDDKDYREPVWCYERFGRTTSELSDGRVLQIAGEHEDSYDPDFCIYNDLSVHYPDGSFELYTYPREVFPPTDFHSATLLGPWLYLIGNLGYPSDRLPRYTPVHRLNIHTLAIERVETKGDGPGWISAHRARSSESGITISGGQVWTDHGLVGQLDEWVLDVAARVWRRKR